MNKPSIIPINEIAQEEHPGTSGTGRFTTPYLLQQWYVACTKQELVKAKAIASKVCGVPLVIFRNSDNRAAALLDRCPHRNVPLSLGTVEKGEVICYYHGWQFNDRGERTRIPGLENSE